MLLPSIDLLMATKRAESIEKRNEEIGLGKKMSVVFSEELTALGKRKINLRDLGLSEGFPETGREVAVANFV